MFPQGNIFSQFQLLHFENFVTCIKYQAFTKKSHVYLRKFLITYYSQEMGPQITYNDSEMSIVSYLWSQKCISGVVISYRCYNCTHLCLTRNANLHLWEGNPGFHYTFAGPKKPKLSQIVVAIRLKRLTENFHKTQS